MNVQPLSSNLSENSLEFKLLNDFQRNFPVQNRPFLALAEQLNVDETQVITRLRALQEAGAVSRVGAIIRPHVIGSSTLVALAVPPARLQQVAAYISRMPEINHNYQREHHFNLWFVATAADAAHLHEVLQRIEWECQCGTLLVLPLVKDYHIDLGFDLYGQRPELAPPVEKPLPLVLTVAEKQLIAALQTGLPLIERPFAALGLPEDWVRATVSAWLAAGVIKRFGVIVRHHELGYRANAMVVWSVADARIDALGQQLAATGLVTLCYQRRPQAPDWHYNLFCMLHGKDRVEVEARIDKLLSIGDLAKYPQAILFSGQRFKQRGAHYFSVSEPVNG